MKLKYLAWMCAPAFALALIACDNQSGEQSGAVGDPAAGGGLGGGAEQQSGAVTTTPGFGSDDQAGGSASEPPADEQTATPAPGMGGSSEG